MVMSTDEHVELLTSRVSAKHTRRVSVKVWVVGLCGVCGTDTAESTAIGKT